MADFDLAEPLGAAVKALFDDERLWFTFTDKHQDLGGPDRARKLAAVVALAVAGPIIARQVREKIAQEIEKRVADCHDDIFVVAGRAAYRDAAGIARGGQP
jgi:hypothetical protein